MRPHTAPPSVSHGGLQGKPHRPFSHVVQEHDGPRGACATQLLEQGDASNALLPANRPKRLRNRAFVGGDVPCPLSRPQPPSFADPLFSGPPAVKPPTAVARVQSSPTAGPYP